MRRRVVCLSLIIVGAACIAFAAYEAWFSFNWARRFVVWERDDVVRFPLDLTGQNESSASFHLDCGVAHAQHVVLALSDADGTMLNGWVVDVESITLESLGSLAHARQLQPGSGLAFSTSRDLGGTTLVRETFGPEGEYRLRVRARPLQRPTDGLKCEIVVRNELCGMERWPGYIAGAIAVISGLIGVVCLAVGAAAGRTGNRSAARAASEIRSTTT